MAYVAILVLLVLMTTMGLAFLYKTGVEASATMGRSDNMATQYLAEAAANHAMWRLLNEPAFPAATDVYYMHDLGAGRYGYKVRRHTDTTFATVAAVGATAQNVVHQSYVIYVKTSDPGDLENKNVEGEDLIVDKNLLMLATQKVLNENMTVGTIGAYVKGSPSKDIRFALYDDAAGEPGALIVETAAENMWSSQYHWHTIAIAPEALTAGMYWVAIAFEQFNSDIKYSAAGEGQLRGRDYDATGSGFPASWGTSDGSDTRRLSMYAD